MYYDCSLVTPTNGTTCVPNAPISKFAFSTGKTHRLRLINAGVESTQKFSIDNHEMTVIAIDFVPVNPYTTKVVTLGIGQRTDVLVKATGRPTDTAWMRSDIDTACFPLAAQPHALAAVYYPRSDRTSLPNSTATPWQSNNCANVSRPICICISSLAFANACIGSSQHHCPGICYESPYISHRDTVFGYRLNCQRHRVLGSHCQQLIFSCELQVSPAPSSASKQPHPALAIHCSCWRN